MLLMVMYINEISYNQPKTLKFLYCHYNFVPVVAFLTIILNIYLLIVLKVYQSNHGEVSDRNVEY